MSKEPSWYIILFVFVLTLVCFLAYGILPAVSATAHVDTSLFHDAALIGFGALVGLVTIKGVNA